MFEQEDGEIKCAGFCTNVTPFSALSRSTQTFFFQKKCFYVFLKQLFLAACHDIIISSTIWSSVVPQVSHPALPPLVPISCWALEFRCRVQGSFILQWSRSGQVSSSRRWWHLKRCWQRRKVFKIRLLAWTKLFKRTWRKTSCSTMRDGFYAPWPVKVLRQKNYSFHVGAESVEYICSICILLLWEFSSQRQVRSSIWYFDWAVVYSVSSQLRAVGFGWAVWESPEAWQSESHDCVFGHNWKE